MKRHATSFLAAGALSLGFAIGAAGAADLPYAESFDGSDGASWPAPWFAGSSHVTVWDLQGNRARLNGDAMQVARMILPDYAAVDVEVEVTVEFENVGGQGIGFYVRQNGGSLREYLPHGQGYAMFLKGSWAWPEDLGLWREIDGIETQFAQAYGPVPGGIANGARYRLRFRVTQSAPGTTLLQAKVWPEAGVEPAGWTIEASDSQPELQGTAGSFAADVYNHFGASHVFLDDLVIRPYPDLAAVADAPSPARLALSTPRPHPVSGVSTFDLSASRPCHAELRVFDAAGRLVARPFTGAIGPAATILSWSAKDERGRRLRPGVYHATLGAPESRVARRIVVTE